MTSHNREHSCLYSSKQFQVPGPPFLVTLAKPPGACTLSNVLIPETETYYILGGPDKEAYFTASD